MSKKLLAFFLVSVFLLSRCSGLDATSAEKEFVVIIASYKNIKWFKQNLDSLMMQERTYTKWRAIYIDDHSPDGTGNAVVQYVKERGFEQKITVIQNEERVGALANFYNAVYLCDDHEIACNLDGDDCILVDNLFCILNDLYADPNVWLTYGQYREYPSGQIGCCCDVSRWVISSNTFRTTSWVTTHLRTFYAGLFKKIRREDLMLNGQFFPMSGDLAFMYPMLEMAGERIKFNPVVVYGYNTDNPISDVRKDQALLAQLAEYIRAMPPYKRIPCLFEQNS